MGNASLSIPAILAISTRLSMSMRIGQTAVRKDNMYQEVGQQKSVVNSVVPLQGGRKTPSCAKNEQGVMQCPIPSSTRLLEETCIT